MAAVTRLEKWTFLASFISFFSDFSITFLFTSFVFCFSLFVSFSHSFFCLLFHFLRFFFLFIIFRSFSSICFFLNYCWCLLLPCIWLLSLLSHFQKVMGHFTRTFHWRQSRFICRCSCHFRCLCWGIIIFPI